MRFVFSLLLFIGCIQKAHCDDLGKTQMVREIIEIQSSMIQEYMQELLPDHRGLKPGQAIALINMGKQIAAGKMLEYFSEEELYHVVSFYHSDIGAQIQAKIPLFLSELSLALSSGEFGDSEHDYDVELLSKIKRIIQENFPDVYIEQGWEEGWGFVTEEFADKLVEKYFSLQQQRYMEEFAEHPLTDAICCKIPSFIVDLMFTYIYELSEQAYQSLLMQEDIIEMDLD